MCTPCEWLVFVTLISTIVRLNSKRNETETRFVMLVYWTCCLVESCYTSDQPIRLLGHLSVDEKLQEMIYEEAERTKLTSLDQIPPLPVTEASLMEAMRLASSPIVPHVAREDTSLGDYFVPKDSAILFNCYNINLSPGLWQEPREFNPRRFLVSTQNELGEISHRLSLPKFFTPFSVGQRQCLGYKMVTSISIMATAHLCSSFRFRPNNEKLVRKLLEPRGTVSLSPLEECFEFELDPRWAGSQTLVRHRNKIIAYSKFTSTVVMIN